MQDMDANLCHAVTVNEVTQLTDTRSGNYTYYIAKLKDDKCWMVQNLRLGANQTFNTGTLTLTPSDSNISSNWVLTDRRNDNTDSPVMPYTVRTDDAIVGIGTNVYVEDLSRYDGKAFFCPFSGAKTENNYVGCYYNWFTATAGTGKGAGDDATPANTDATSSICPKGWYLPKGGTAASGSNDFQNLYLEYPSVIDMLVPGITTTDNTSGQPKPGLTLNGLYYSSGASGIGIKNYYWSRTAYSIGLTYGLTSTDSVVSPVTSNLGKYYGMSVRCLAYGS